MSRRTVSTVDIIAPVHNEVATVDEFHRRVRALGLRGVLTFVDNASTDGTLERLTRMPDVRVIRHARNEGYGASVRDGILATSAPLIVVIDADLEYPPEAIPALLEALRTHAVVHCSRFLGAKPPEMAAVRRWGNRIASSAYNLLFGQHVTDLYSGMRGFRRDALSFHTLRLGGFEHGAEIAALIALSGHHLHEIPIEYRPRSHGRSKMRHLPEVAKYFGYLLWFWLRGVILRRPLHRPQAGDATPH